MKVKDRFRKNKAAAEGATGSAPQMTIQQLQQSVMGLAYQIYNLSQTLDAVKTQLQLVDVRSLALMEVMVKELKVEESSILAEAEKFQINIFNNQSSQDDQKRKLMVADDEVAATGMSAIVQVNFFQDGQELTSQRLIRSKITLGKEELIKGLDEQLTGLKVGDSKSFDRDLGEGKSVTVTVTLLGLRKQLTEQQQQATQPAGQA